MTQKRGYIGGFFLGLLIYSFSNPSLLRGYLPHQGQVFMDYLVPFLTIVAVIMGFAIVFKKISVKTTDRGLIFGASGTVAILWILGTYIPR